MRGRAPPAGAGSGAAGAPGPRSTGGGPPSDDSPALAMPSDESEQEMSFPKSPSAMSLASDSESDGGGDEVDVSLLPDDGAHGVTQGSEGEVSMLPAGGGPSSGAWVPGANTGRYICPGAAVGPQAEVLAVNVFHTLRSLPKESLQSLERALPPGPGLQGGRHVERSARVAGRLLSMHSATVKLVYYRVRQNGWLPSAGQRQGVARTGRRAPTDVSEQDALAQPHKQDALTHARLMNTVRIAIAHAQEGGSFREFPNRLWMHHLTGADVSMAAVGRDFFKAVVALASLSVSHLDADDFNGDLPGLGIPSDSLAYAAPPTPWGSPVIQLPAASPATVPVQHARRLSFEGAREAVLAKDEQHDNDDDDDDGDDDADADGDDDGDDDDAAADDDGDRGISWEASRGPVGGSFEASWGPFGGFLSWVPLGASWKPLGASWGFLRAEGSNFRFVFPSWAPSGAVLGPSWGLLGRLGASWAVLAASWAVLGPSWGVLERSSGVSGASWAVLGASWGLTGAFWSRLLPHGAFGPAPPLSKPTGPGSRGGDSVSHADDPQGVGGF